MTGTESFLKYLKFEKRYSAHTLLSYENDLSQFCAFLEKKNKQIDLNKVDDRTIRDWILALLNEGISQRSVNRKLTTLKVFYRHQMREGKVTKNPVNRLNSLKVKKKLPEFVEERNINQLIDEYEFGADFKGVRNQLVIEMLYNTGMRLAELLNIKKTDINRADGSIKILGKRNKERIIPLTTTFLRQIEKYILLQENTIKSDCPFLFITEKGAKMYPRMVYRIVHRYLQFATTIDKKSPHVLRHTFATHMLNHGADLNTIKELLGHSNLAATQIYTHNTFEKLKNIYKQAHPRA